MRGLIPALLSAAILMLVPPQATAATIDDVLRLSAAGVSDEVILALLDRDKTIFAVDSEQIVKLRSQGVSEKVLMALLKNGRAESEAALRQQAADAAALPPQEPIVVVVGHGPDRPNVAHPDGFFFPGPYPLFTYPYFLSYGAYPLRPSRCAVGARPMGSAVRAPSAGCQLPLLNSARPAGARRVR